MTSLFEQSLLLVGDAIAMSMVRKRDIDLDSCGSTTRIWSRKAALLLFSWVRVRC